MSIKLATHTTLKRKHLYRVAKDPVMSEINRWLMPETGIEFWDIYCKKWRPSAVIYFSDLLHLTDKEKASL